jgi:hypothetical protein
MSGSRFALRHRREASPLTRVVERKARPGRLTVTFGAAVNAVLARKRRAQAAQRRRHLDHAGTRDDVAADESVFP